MNEATVRDVSRQLALLNGTGRLRILAVLLSSKEVTVTDLGKQVGMAQPAVSHHLGLLRTAGVIDFRKVGKHSLYSIRSKGFRNLCKAVFNFTKKGAA